MDTIIRESKPEDLDQYTDLLQQTYQHAYIKEEIGLTADCFSKEIFNNSATQKYLKSNLISTANQKTWLSFNGDDLMGSITCNLQNDQKAELKGFYVRQKYQGRGIGQKLYKKALAFAGDRDLILDIYSHNAETVKLYQKWGWKLDEEQGNKGHFTRHWEEWPEGLEIDCIYMKLKR